MFGKLKEKLKSTLSIFSKKAEEEAEVKEEVIEKIEEEVQQKEVVKPREVKKEPKAEKEKKEPIKEPKEPRQRSVLLFHGWEDNSESGFIPSLREYLNKHGYKAKSFDQPNTEAPEFEQRFSFTEEKIHDSNKEDLSLIGHSMGGLLALKVAEKYNIKKLILIAPVGSRPSEKYFTEMGKRLNREDLDIFKKYQNQSLNSAAIKKNAVEIAFVFGLKDPWITEEIRNFYIESFKDVAEIHVFDRYLHMSESEGVTDLPIVRELFARKIKPSVVEHKDQKKEKVVEEKPEEKEGVKEKSKEKKVEERAEPQEAPKIKIQEEKGKEVPEREEAEEPEEKRSFFSKVKQSLTTKTISAEKFEELFWDLEIVLLENNVSVEVIEKIKEDLKEELVEKPLPRDVPRKIEETLKQTLKEILTYEPIDLLKKANSKKGPFVIAVFGINGTGKTTSIAKLAHYVEKNNIKVVMIDTAGRLHSNTNLMAELEKIIRVAKPDFKIFVGESITGNDCIEQAKTFNKLVEMDGAILTKADVDEKGGAPLSISYTIKKPILFLGIGQRYQDLEEFNAEVILKRLGF